ncbi:hypothetical protein C7271_17500 [filamentous cyanobacterium CCP5]|nr:hypothetical protein C7271_17500 [filamentous cyanobacterium CCP5]
MTTPSLVEAPQQPTHRQVQAFLSQFGPAHLQLACHAALPLAFTPELLYGLWVNFQEDCHGNELNIPWVAVSDLLLSGLCDEVGYQLYEIKRSLRRDLLHRLTADPALGPRRTKELSQFLSNYVQVQLRSEDPDIRDFAQAQQWTALAYTEAEQAAEKLFLALSDAHRQENPDLLRIALIVEALEDPLADFPDLLAYARGMAHFARGELDAAEAEFNEFNRLRLSGDPSNINDIKLSIPQKTERYTEPIQPPKLKLVMPSPFWWTAGLLSVVAWGNVVWVMRPQVEEARRFGIAMSNPDLEIPELTPPDATPPDLDDYPEDSPVPPPISRPNNPPGAGSTEPTLEPGSDSNPADPSLPPEGLQDIPPEQTTVPPQQTGPGGGQAPGPGGSDTLAPGPADNPQSEESAQEVPRLTGIAALQERADLFNQDLTAIRRLQEEIAAELATVRGRVDVLEANVAEMEATGDLSGISAELAEFQDVRERSRAIENTLETSLQQIITLGNEAEALEADYIAYLTDNAGNLQNPGRLEDLPSPQFGRDDVRVTQRLSEEFAAELATLRGRQDFLEASLADLQSTRGGATR